MAGEFHDKPFQPCDPTKPVVDTVAASRYQVAVALIEGGRVVALLDVVARKYECWVGRSQQAAKHAIVLPVPGGELRVDVVGK